MQKSIAEFADQRVLLLQGPLGPFFKRLSRDLVNVGATVSKVNFNGGDWLFYRDGVGYRGKLEDWPGYLTKILTEWKIDVVLMYGDCRPVHACVRNRAEQCGVKVGVFEAGYVRPYYITLEKSGINDYSTLPRSAEFYATRQAQKVPPPQPVGNVFWYSALWAVLYYVASSLLWPFFPHYQHHRRLSVREAGPWIRGLWRKYYYQVKERGIRQQLERDYSGRFFLLPLQVHYDSQMHVHSSYLDVETFIRSTLEDFAKNAPADAVLVVKHHPMDRAYRDYTTLCRVTAERYGIKGRVLYVHELHLPTIFKHARGVVVVNSTVGLSALLEGLPVKVCGRAVYDISGLTYSGLLGDFWEAAPRHRPNNELLRRFHAYLITATQVNGSVYKRLPDTGFHSGVMWRDGVGSPNKQVRSAHTAEQLSLPGYSKG